MSSSFRYKAYDVEGGVELVSPFLACKEERVSLIEGAKLEDWQPVFETLQLQQQDQPIHSLVHGAEPCTLSLPRPNHTVSSSKHGWVVNGSCRARGITAQIARRLCGRSRNRQQHRYRRYTKPCVGIGISVDKELKQFSRGEVPFEALQTDSKGVVEHLFKRDVSLVDGAVLVSNFQENDSQDCSATEIDLIGFDHVKREFVVIELKVTSSSFQEMKSKLKRARKDKSGFRRCVLGRYVAQVALTLKMFAETYSMECDGILLVVEHRNSRAYDMNMDYDTCKDLSFHSWIMGY